MNVVITLLLRDAMHSADMSQGVRPPVTIFPDCLH